MKTTYSILILAIAILIVTSNNAGNDLNAIDNIRTIDSPTQTNVDTFTVEKFKKLLISLNVKYPDIVFAQAKIESGNFKSKIFRENHNLFGMKEAKQRAHTAIGTQYSHAIYSNWRQSVIDYTIYQSCYLRKFNRSEYIDYLGRNYAQDKNYVTKVVAIAKQSKKYFS